MREREPEHDHHALGMRVSTAKAAPEQMHIHITSDGVTASAPNRPGHRHLLRSGAKTQPSVERWSLTATPL
jgi:hypothetical protein